MCRYLDESIVISGLVSLFRWHTPDGGQAQGGGAVWRRGGVVDGPNKVTALITLEDELAEDVYGGF